MTPDKSRFMVRTSFVAVTSPSSGYRNRKRVVELFACAALGSECLLLGRYCGTKQERNPGKRYVLKPGPWIDVVREDE
jgi:hypothetical protein